MYLAVGIQAFSFNQIVRILEDKLMRWKLYWRFVSVKIDPVMRVELIAIFERLLIMAEIFSPAKWTIIKYGLKIIDKSCNYLIWWRDVTCHIPDIILILSWIDNIITFRGIRCPKQYVEEPQTICLSGM